MQEAEKKARSIGDIAGACDSMATSVGCDPCSFCFNNCPNQRDRIRSECASYVKGERSNVWRMSRADSSKRNRVKEMRSTYAKAKKDAEDARGMIAGLDDKIAPLNNQGVYC